MPRAFIRYGTGKGYLVHEELPLPRSEDPRVLAIARQVATYNGQIFDKVNPKVRAALLTLATSIIATMERLR